jgi:predicted RecA/RadA family phage recombinase
MKNYVQSGDTIALVAPANVSAGGFVRVGTIAGIAANDALSGAEVIVQVGGVYDIPKTAAQAWTQGALLYWSGTAATTVVTGSPIGAATRAELAAATVGRVRMNPNAA